MHAWVLMYLWRFYSGNLMTPQHKCIFEAPRCRGLCEFQACLCHGDSIAFAQLLVPRFALVYGRCLVSMVCAVRYGFLRLKSAYTHGNFLPELRDVSR
jgi:hypothetical protein